MTPDQDGNAVSTLLAALRRRGWRGCDWLLSFSALRAGCGLMCLALTDGGPSSQLSGFGALQQPQERVDVAPGNANNADRSGRQDTMDAREQVVTSLQWRRTIGANGKVDSIAALRALPDAGRTGLMDVLGYYVPSDGGGGQFYWNATSRTNDDGGIVIAVRGVAIGRWHRVCGSEINVRWFGALGNRLADDYEPIARACQVFSEPYNGRGECLYFPSGWYLVSRSLVLNCRNKTIRGDSQLSWLECTRPEPALVLASSYPGAPPVSGLPATKHECDNLTVHDLGFVAPAEARASLQVGGLAGNPVFADTDEEYPVTNVRLHHCWFQAAPLYLFRVWDSAVRSCAFEGQPYFSIMILSSGRMQITDCTTYSSGGGMYINENPYLPANRTPYGIVFAKNLVTLSWEGIASLNNCQDVLVLDNVGVALGRNSIQQPEQSGIFIGAGTQRLQILHNVIRSSETLHTEKRLRYGIEMASASRGTVILGNDTSDTNYSNGDLLLQPHGLLSIAGGVSIRHPNSDWNWMPYSAPGRLSLEQPGVAERLTILTTNGDVGINDPAPTARLSVSGRFAVRDDGSVRANSVIESRSGGFRFPDGSTQLTAAPSTIQHKLVQSGPVVVDFQSPFAPDLQLTGNVAFVSANLAANRRAHVRIKGAATNCLVTWPGWRFLGATPTQISAGKLSILNLEAWGSADGDVVADFAEEGSATGRQPAPDP